MKRIEWTYALILILPIVILAQYDNSDLPPGPYCGQRRVGCCDGRRDECAAPIIGIFLFLQHGDET